MSCRRWSGVYGFMLAALTLTAIAAIVGCGGSSSSAARQSVSANWDYYDNANNEAPYFGDPEIQQMGADPTYARPQPTPSKASGIPDPAADSIFIRVVWGNLIFNPDDPGPWRYYSGEIAIDDGAMYILRAIAFESSDSAIPDRHNAKTIAWTSKIWPSFDGRLIRLDPGPTAAADNMLHVQIGVFEQEYSVAELAGGMIVIDPTGDPNGPDDHVALAAHQISAATNGSGFVWGHWRDFNGVWRQGGVFKGKWEADAGDVWGHERVRYWPATGEARGKYIDDAGANKGRLRGAFKVENSDAESGSFEFDWWDRTLTDKIGTVNGVYLKQGEVGHGFAMGNWVKD